MTRDGSSNGLRRLSVILGLDLPAFPSSELRVADFRHFVCCTERGPKFRRSTESVEDVGGVTEDDEDDDVEEESAVLGGLCVEAENREQIKEHELNTYKKDIITYCLYDIQCTYVYIYIY